MGGDTRISGRRRGSRPGRAWIVLAATLAGFAAPGTGARADIDSADDLLIVDCLLPPQVRRLGRRSTFLAARRPLRTTAVECRIRGGEHTAPDQANLGTALAVWLPQAEAGDAQAQYYVGQMFERGLGVEPDFAAAATWYLKAADQGFAAAQVNLGSLYETGRGVARDGEEALRWYRRAAGLAEDLVVLQEAELDALTDELEATERRLDETADELDKERRDSDELRRREQELERQVQKLEEGADTATAERPTLAFGAYHALVIGNGDYAALPPLPTALADARRVADTLERAYGFRVRRLENAGRLEIMRALNALREELTSEDNLLVYYAGHAGRDPTGVSAYWQPVDASPESPAQWIPSELVAEHLDLVPARHALVVSDALFSGLRTRSAIATLPGGMTETERHYHIRLLNEKRCRLALVSGSARPAATPGGEHSAFALALVESLSANQGILESTALYRDVSRRMTGAAAPSVPELAALQWARNDVSEFFFVRSGP